MQYPVFEILSWRSAEGVSDEEMIKAMEGFGERVQELSGFIYQSLHKNSDQQWVCVYFWQTQQQAHDSNAAVANTPEFARLMNLIDTDSLTMEVMPTLQHTGQQLISAETIKP